MEGTSQRRVAGSTRSADALERLYRQNVRVVYAYATARLGRSGGEDVTGEVFHAAAVAFADGRSAQVTPAWLMTVARNKVIDRWRRAERRMARAHLLDAADDPPDPLALTLDHERRDRVLDALSALNRRHRMLLVLHYLETMSTPDIAAALGTTQASIESALARARARFRKEYERGSAS